jgi:hypothetical protein
MTAVPQPSRPDEWAQQRRCRGRGVPGTLRPRAPYPDGVTVAARHGAGTFALGHKSPSSPQPLRHSPSLEAVPSAGSFSRQAFWIANETGQSMPNRRSRSALHAKSGVASSQTMSLMWEVLTARAARRDAPKQMKSVHTPGGLVDGDVAARERAGRHLRSATSAGYGWSVTSVDPQANDGSRPDRGRPAPVSPDKAEASTTSATGRRQSRGAPPTRSSRNQHRRGGGCLAIRPQA